MTAKNEIEAEAPEDALKVEKPKLTLRSFLLNYNAIIILVVMIIVASLVSDIFFTTKNLNTVLRQQSTYLVIAIGMLMVIILGGIDLSAAGTVALTSIVMVVANTSWGLGTIPSIIAGLLVGVVIGLFNGFFVANLRMPAFIVTLALSYITEGIAFTITKGNTLLLDKTGETYASLVYPGFATMVIPAIMIPYMFLVALAIVILFFIIMKYTKFGRLVYAVGSNESAVQLAGINSKKIILKVYLLESILCAIAGVLITCRTGNASALTCSGDYALSTVAAVVIGGASLAGGEGTVLMTVVGVFVIAIISNIMNLIGLPSYPQMIVKGAIIIFAVILKGVSSKKQN